MQGAGVDQAFVGYGSMLEGSLEEVWVPTCEREHAFCCGILAE